MSKNIVTIDAGADLVAAYSLLQKHKFRHLPVVDDAGNIVGILSDRDLNRAARSEFEGIAEEGCRLENVSFDPASRVRDYMSWPVKSFAATTSIAAVATAMIREKVSAFLVTDGDGSKIVGIVTTEDCLRVLVELLRNDDTNGRKWNLSALFRESANGLIY